MNKCPVCGKDTPLRPGKKNKYCTFCSNECRLSIKGREFIKQKQQNTFKKINWEEVNKKRKQTCLEKYGVDNPAKLEPIRQKISNTKKNSDIVSINEKRKQTCLEKYGVEYVTQSIEIIQKKRETWEKKHGGHPMRNKLVKNKVSEKLLRNYYNNVILKSELFIPLFSIDEWIDKHGATSHDDEHAKIFKFQCKVCGEQFEQNLWNGFSICECPKCHPPNISEPQIEIKQFIQSLLPNEEILINTKKSPIYPLELDIYIPSRKFAIEYNGLAFHSFGISKHSLLNNADMETIQKYHILEKLKKCEENDIFLFNIFENEWIDPVKKAIWKGIIANYFGTTKKIMARKCVVKEVDSLLAQQFLELNHLQGNASSKIRLGLFYENELVQIMTFAKPRFNKKYEWEIVRFATKNDLRVIGGAGKLLAEFIRKYKPLSIISYADRRISKGDVYLKLGFIEQSPSKPNYFYFKENTKKLFPREKFQKHKLKNELENFDPVKSERDNMYINGYRRIYDCGNKVFVWNSLK